MTVTLRSAGCAVSARRPRSVDACGPMDVSRSARSDPWSLTMDRHSRPAEGRRHANRRGDGTQGGCLNRIRSPSGIGAPRLRTAACAGPSGRAIRR